MIVRCKRLSAGRRGVGASECGLAPRVRVHTRMVAWDSDGGVGLGWGTPWGARGPCWTPSVTNGPEDLASTD